MQERRRSPASQVLATFHTTPVPESSVGPPAHVAPELQNKARQSRRSADQVWQDVHGSGKPVKDRYLTPIGNGGAPGPPPKRTTSAPHRPTQFVVYDVAHEAIVSSYRTNIIWSPVVQWSGRRFFWQEYRAAAGAPRARSEPNLRGPIGRGTGGSWLASNHSRALGYLTGEREAIKVVRYGST
jgi:hypothetical protein